MWRHISGEAALSVKTLQPFPTRIRVMVRRRQYEYFPETPTSNTRCQIHYSIPKLLGRKYFGNYGSMGTDLIIHSNIKVLHLKAHNFQKASKTVKSSHEVVGAEAILQKKLRLRQVLLHNLPMNHSIS